MIVTSIILTTISLNSSANAFMLGEPKKAIPRPRMKEKISEDITSTIGGIWMVK